MTHPENPGSQVKDTSDGNSQLITIAVAVLSVIILVIGVFLWFFFIRRPRIKGINVCVIIPKNEAIDTHESTYRCLGNV